MRRAPGPRAGADDTPGPAIGQLFGLGRVVEHPVGNLLVVAEAIVRLEALQAQVGQVGQMLALGPPERGATLGGLVSANASRPRRLRYGAVRDLRIGVTVVSATGGRTPVSPSTWTATSARYPPFRKECVHARRLPAGL